jgi:MoaA/NifB/PqqE/SkfB family radical SAM enzyme
MSSFSLDAEEISPLCKYLQIELTNRCNLSCSTCLHGVPDIKLKEQDLSNSVLQGLEAVLQRTSSVHLQGWGESLLLSDLPERIRWFKVKKCKVSFSTSGTLMTSRLANELVASGLDGITFSMAGASPLLQDGLRGQGTHLTLMQSMQLLQSAKKQQRSSIPALAVSYLLTGKSIKELPQAVKMCRPFGLSLFAGVHMTHPATGRQEVMRLYSSCKEQSFKRLIRRAHWHAFWGGMRLQLPAFQPDLTPICDKNPLAGCFVAADGAVAPCVFLYPPVSTAVKLDVNSSGREFLPVPRKSFGSLHEKSLDQIWQKSEYQTFRKAFQQRLEVYEKEMGRVGCGMNAFTKLDLAKKRIQKTFLSIPAPVCCRNCPKMEGF